MFNTRAVELAGRTFEESRLVVFPAIRLGYRFR
jgi:hypothetical protein